MHHALTSLSGGAAPLRAATALATELTPAPQLLTPLQRVARELAPGQGLVDCGGSGNCGPLSLSFLLRRLGLDPGDHRQLRTAVAAHAADLAVRARTIADEASPSRGAKLTVADAIVASYATWCGSACASADAYAEHIAQPGVYFDTAALVLVADMHAVAISVHLVDAAGRRIPCRRILPPNNVAPIAELRLAAVADEHFVAIVDVAAAVARGGAAEGLSSAKAAAATSPHEVGPSNPPRETRLCRGGGEQIVSTYVECPHGFVLVAGQLDKSIEPRCSRTACLADARQWWRASSAELSAAGPSPLPSLSEPASTAAVRHTTAVAAVAVAAEPACRGWADSPPHAGESPPHSRRSAIEQTDSSPLYLRAEAARDEYATFTWPIRDLTELRRLLRCQHIAPTDFVGFEFSGAVRQARERLGHVAISVDRRECEVGGMHACLEVQDAIAVAHWAAAFLFPSCFQQLRADEDCLALKINDGRAFWGCLQVVWCLHAPADAVVVEQPDTIVHDFLVDTGTPFYELRTSQLGDRPDKFVRLYAVGASMDLPRHAGLRTISGSRSQFLFADADERDRYRSSWRPFIHLTQRVAAAHPTSRFAPDYANAAEAFACWWHAQGWPVPSGYLASDARPLSMAEREYQLRRGAGDGRDIDAVTPVSLRMAAAARSEQRHSAEELAAHGDECDVLSDDGGDSGNEGTGDVHVTRGGGAAALPLPSLSGPPLLDLRAATAAATICVFISILMQPLVFAHANGFTVVGAELPSRVSRSQCLATAQQWTAAAAGATQLAYMVGEYIGGARLCTAPLEYAPPPIEVCCSRGDRLRRLAAGASFLWCTLAAIAGTPSADAASRAFVATEAFVQPVASLADFASASDEAIEFRFGAAPARSVSRASASSLAGGGPAWRALARSHRYDSLLRDALRGAADDSLLDGWLERIRPVNAADIPPELLASAPSFADSALDAVLFSPITPPVSTPWLPLPPRQPPAPPEAPDCVGSPYDMMLPETRALVHLWLNASLSDMLSIRRQLASGVLPANVIRDRPPPLAIGQSELHEWARGLVWDCTREASECCIVADFHAPFETHLDRDYLGQRLADYPDRTLVANLLEGVRLDADLELQTVLIPHLQSLPFGFASVEKELRKLRDKGWYAFFSEFPYFPMYVNGQGAAAKKLTPDVWRRTTEGGGPRRPTYDASGLRALSINEASRAYHLPLHFARDARDAMQQWLASRGLPRPADEELPPGFSKWPKETKPTVEQLMRDVAVLRRSAEILGEPIYIFVEDCASYFNQLRMASSERHKLGIIFVAAEGDLPDLPSNAADTPRLIFVSEKVLGFGTHGASNIAQRFSDSLMHLFRRDMDAADAESLAADTPAMVKWRAGRRKAQQSSGRPCEHRDHGEVCEQMRLYTAHMYTDDPAFCVVGVQRALRALRVWRQLTTNVGLIMAAPEKRSIGTHAGWLGVVFLVSLGIVVIPRDKILRAAKAVRDVLHDGIPFHAYRSLCGLLEHLRAVNLRGKHVMHGLYKPHGPGGVSRFGPAATVRCDVLMRKQLQRWQGLLAESWGVAATQAVHRDEITPPPRLVVALCADACLGDDDPPGIGGFCHGAFWHFAIPCEHHSLVTTPLLELLATVGNFLVFHDYLCSFAAYDVQFLFRTDALTTALTLPAESQRAPLMVAAFQWLIDRPEFQQLAPRSKIAHLFGDCNPLSDSISRQRWQTFRQLCAQLSIKPVHLATPPSFTELYAYVIACAREQSRTLLELTSAPQVLGACGGKWTDDFARRIGGSSSASAPCSADAPAPPTPAAAALLVRIRGASTPAPPAIPPSPAPTLHRAPQTLALPTSPPGRPERPPSSLTAASHHYAATRAANFAAGGGAMAIAESTVLTDSLAAIDDYANYGVNVNTASKDDRAWLLWEQVCARLRTSPLRTAADVRDHPERNAHLLGCLYLHAFAVCQPKDKSRQCVKPKSALAYPLAIIRIFKRWGIHLPGYAALKAQLHGMSRLYVMYHGPHSLAPRRAEPMRFSMVRRIHSIAPGSRVGQYIWTDDHPRVFIFRRLNLFLIRTGFRLGEIVWHPSNEIMYITRSSLTWRIGGVLYTDPSIELLRRLQPGRDAALVAPPRSKPDQWGEIHCPFPVTLTYTTEADNAANALRDIEARYPCHGVERGATPLFCDADRSPLRHSACDALLRTVLTHLYGPRVASLYSWHSYRSGLATALHAAGVPDAMIQLICRWMCPESLHVYRRMGSAEHEANITRAAAANVDLIQSINVPRVSADAAYAAVISDLNGRGSARIAAAFDNAAALGRDTIDDAPSTAAPRAPQSRSPPTLTSPAAAGERSAAPPPPPLRGQAARGRRVLVPRRLWPAYPCAEHAGAGWEAVVVSTAGSTAVVHFTYDRASNGLPYEDVRLPLDQLQPLA